MGENDSSGALVLAAGKLADRSAKTKANISLVNIVAPTQCILNCELQYTLMSADGASSSERKHALEWAIPATTCLTPATMAADDVAEWMQMHRQGELLSCQAAQELALSASDEGAAS